MQPESETGVTAGGTTPATVARRRGEARSRAGRAAGGRAEQPIARIRQLVAAMRAEQDTSAPIAGDPRERIQLMGWLRRIMETRARERQAWEEQVKALEARFALADNAARAALEAVGQADAQHQRLVTDLKLMHEHQRSIWELERRRLEITVDALQRERRNRLIARAARLARPAVVLGLLLVSLAAVALSADSSALSRHVLLDRNEFGPATIVALD
jgi:hypothetical protein